ncbi:hypothetical protein [Nesterenkonia alkaliphila]|uniref:Uncharacterized protein n=1 Tax=Nesterenkonia alkaliphila TaxID=1463631 RepID=A0A7K1UHK7_9MICC|nr:hypothetical protein [Nesterenkonia alkaliphila]MVT25953.1 hypothetical protein [Nesterenkonia alkaliphila]GFZ95751.1 hypothetical protein GCM10011359_26530 [Nesterenkonia alkaliphila]
MIQNHDAAPTPDQDSTTAVHLTTEQVEQQIVEAQRLHQQLTERLRATEQTSGPAGR